MINHAQKHQVDEGFGTSINTWHADVAAAYQQNEFLKFYRETLGASALRIELWNGVAIIERERWQDITWRDFQFDDTGTRGAIAANIARRLAAASGNTMRIIGSVWSPPAWMKVNMRMENGHPERKNFALNFDNPVELGAWTAAQPGSTGGERYTYLGRNKLRRDRYTHFAKLLVEWVRYYRSIGAPLYAISPSNEPRFSHWFGSCVYTPVEYAELTETIAWMFAQEGETQTLLFGPEHMTWDIAGNRAYLDALASRGNAMRAIAAIASHGYVDGYAADTRSDSTAAMRRLASPYGKKLWVTEGGFGGHEWPETLNKLGAAMLYALRDGNVSLFTTWQAITRDPPDEHGLMTLGGRTKKTYVAMQFWRFIRPGMTRIAAEISPPLQAVAFEAPGSTTTVVVVLNRTRNNVGLSLAWGGGIAHAVESVHVTDRFRDCIAISGPHDHRLLQMPPESIVTLTLKAA
jgi:O-glycosyl hydrolase